MRPSLGKSCLAVVRSVAGLTQGQLANLVGVSRPAIQAIELGKLCLSRRLAEQISLHTGVSMAWLLANNYRAQPTCQDTPQERYTKTCFERRRAEIENPRLGPGDRLVQLTTLGSVYGRLAAMLLRAYRENKTIYFQHKLRFLLEDLEAQFPRAKDFPVSSDPKVITDQLRQLLEKASTTKKLMSPR